MIPQRLYCRIIKVNRPHNSLLSWLPWIHTYMINDKSNQFSTEYLPTLDGWRAIAIILVLFSHGFESFYLFLDISPANYAEEIRKIGLLGVQIFFGLSGLLITTKLLQEENRNGSVSLKGFYWRRAFRILPASLFFLTIAGLLAWIGVLNISWERWLSTLTFAANYSNAEHNWYLGHFWSLAVEEHFYFIWPIIFILLKFTEKRIVFVLISIILLAIWRALDFRYQIIGDDSAKFWGRTDIAVDGILWGVLLALMLSHLRFYTILTSLLKHSLAWPILLFTLVVLQSLSDIHWTLTLGLISIKALVIPLLIATTILQFNTWKGIILEFSLLRYIGRLSYSLYLWQQLFLVWNNERISTMDLVQTFPVNLFSLFLCANFSLFFIEKPLINWSRNYRKRLS